MNKFTHEKVLEVAYLTACRNAGEFKSTLIRHQHHLKVKPSDTSSKFNTAFNWIADLLNTSCFENIRQYNVGVSNKHRLKIGWIA